MIRTVSTPLDQRLEPGRCQLHSAGLLSFGPSNLRLSDRSGTAPEEQTTPP